MAETDADEEQGRGHAYERLAGFIGQRYARLRPAGEPAPPIAPVAFSLGGDGVIRRESPLPVEFRRTRVLEFRGRLHQQRNAQTPLPGMVAFDLAAAPVDPPSQWVPIGPSVVRKGQAANRPAVSGRVPGIAVARGGKRVYAASANGGVWRSDDGGATWASTMEAFNLQPTAFCSDSLACGAIAVDPADADRVFVGSGEGDNVFINGATVEGTGAYFGVGPIRTDDGGASWRTEPAEPNSPPLTGSSFYRLAIDPANREQVLGATTVGLYRREPDGAGGFQWRQAQAGIFTSVVAAVEEGHGTLFFAANFGGSVVTSRDGGTWSSVAAGLPSANVGRIGLAAAGGVVYGLICRADNFHILGVWRHDAGAAEWKPVTGAPSDLFGPSGSGQGTYDLAIAVDPANVNRIYLGGSTKLAGNQWAASLFRAEVHPQAAGFAMTAVHIGANVHADIHTLELTPGNPDELWVGCDGGVFHADNATGAADFRARNTGLITITMNHLGIHPEQDAVLYCGTQDNGTVRFTGEEAWLHSAPGDGGYVAVNCANPFKVLRTYVQNSLALATDGGQGYASWKSLSVPVNPGFEDVEFYAPLASAPASSRAGDADVAAFGSVRPWVSEDFGTTWRSIPGNSLATDRLDSTILSLSFHSATKFYAGTREGGVYRCEKTGGAWAVKALQASPLLKGPVTAMAIDHADESGDSLYLCFGGIGDARRVWHFDGTRAAWEARSGSATTPGRALMDVQHNAIVADPRKPGTLYTGADIGIWRSTDGGANWQPFAEGLPEAAVLDLKLHPSRRLLWAATYGRGVYERAIDSDTAPAVELYIRDTQLDRGRYPAADGAADPTRPGVAVSFRAGPDIKIDAPDAAGNFQMAAGQADFFAFVDGLQDAGARVSRDGGAGVNHVYVQVHNRAALPAAGVAVTLLLAPLAGGTAPDLPAGFDASVRAGTAVQGGGWTTAGVARVEGVKAGAPQIARFELPASALTAAPACLLVLLHAAGDAYTNGATAVDALCLSERKAAQRIL